LTAHGKYKTNNKSGLSTSFFFFTEETVDGDNDYHARMLCIENDNCIEDAATGSANGCFLAYLLKNVKPLISVKVEQGFHINRLSFLLLDGSLSNTGYDIRVSGQVVSVGSGMWHI